MLAMAIILVATRDVITFGVVAGTTLCCPAGLR
jgi:hypothetical protein